MFTLRFFVGEHVFDEKDGKGTVIAVDENNILYPYEIEFKNGTIKWGSFPHIKITFNQFLAFVEFKNRAAYKLKAHVNCSSDLFNDIEANTAKELHSMFVLRAERHLNFCHMCNEEPQYLDEIVENGNYFFGSAITNERK